MSNKRPANIGNICKVLNHKLQEEINKLQMDELEGLTLNIAVPCEFFISTLVALNKVRSQVNSKMSESLLNNTIKAFNRSAHSEGLDLTILRMT